MLASMGGRSICNEMGCKWLLFELPRPLQARNRTSNTVSSIGSNPPACTPQATDTGRWSCRAHHEVIDGEPIRIKPPPRSQGQYSGTIELLPPRFNALRVRICRISSSRARSACFRDPPPDQPPRNRTEAHG